MALAVVEQVIRPIGGIGLALPIGGQAKGGADRGDDAAILPLADKEALAMRGRAGVDEVVDMQGRVVRSDDGRPDIATLDIAPCPGIAIDPAMSPADHCVGAIKVAVGQMLGTDQVGQVFPRC